MQVTTMSDIGPEKLNHGTMVCVPIISTSHAPSLESYNKGEELHVN
jgi:hypothetical protein